THNSSYIPMLQRIANSPDVPALRTLADVLEPTKEYSREDLAKVPPTTLDPFNRLVDAVRPESDVARLFASQVDNFLSGKCKVETTRGQIRSSLILWRDNDAKLRPQLGRNSLIQEAAPLSQNLSITAGAGLQALDYIERHQKPSDAWK